MTALTLNSTRFGTLEVRAEDLITFQDGVIGFPACREFVLIEHKPGGPFLWMQSVQEADLAFLVVDPGHYIADYAPPMPHGDVKSLALTEDTPRVVYALVSIPKGNPQGMTLNLAGPIVVNARTRQARQVILEESGYPLRHRVFPEAPTAEESSAA